jgi:preprotein translocase subunit SecA
MDMHLTTTASRARLQERYAQVLAEYIGSPLSSVEESENMSDFLKQPRIEAVNLNALDHATGSLLLHEAAR